MRNLKISVGKSRYEKSWKNIDITWEELKNMLCKPFITHETVEEYKNFLSQKKKKLRISVGSLAVI